MPVSTLDPRTALVVIDLQKGITALPTIVPADTIVANAARLAAAFRSRGLPVVLVRTSFAHDGADMLTPRNEQPPPSLTRAPDFAELRPELARAHEDIVITKHQWDAFFGTELDLQLRRRGVTGIVLVGISTSIGVEFDRPPGVLARLPRGDRARRDHRPGPERARQQHDRDLPATRPDRHDGRDHRGPPDRGLSRERSH